MGTLIFQSRLSGPQPWPRLSPQVTLRWGQTHVQQNASRSGAAWLEARSRTSGACGSACHPVNACSFIPDS